MSYASMDKSGVLQIRLPSDSALVWWRSSCMFRCRFLIMTLPETQTNTLPQSLGVLGLAIFVCLGFTAASPNPGVVNDVAQIVNVARNMAAGNGIATDSLYYTEHYATASVPAPQTVFPPGQSFVISIAMRCGMDGIRASRLFAAVGFVLLPLTVFWLCLAARTATKTSLIAAILWLCVILAWTNTRGGKSDIPFMALTMLSAVCLTADKNQLRNAFAAGIFAAFALSVRYAGLFFMTAVGLTLLIEWFRDRTRSRFLQLCLFSLPSGATAFAFFARNYSIVGDIKGGNNYAVDKSVFDIGRNVYRSFSSLFGLDYARFAEGGVGEWILVAVILIGVVLLAAGGKANLKSLVERTSQNRATVLCFIYPIVTVLMLLLLEVKSQPGTRDRMFMAALPFAFCLVAKWFDLPDNTWNPLKRVFVLLCVLGFLFGQVNVAKERFGKVHHEQHWYRMQNLLDTPMSKSETILEYLQKEITAEQPLIANETQRLSEIIERPVLGLASFLYTQTNWADEDVHQLAKDFDAEYLLVLTDEYSLDFEEVEFFVRVANGEEPPWMELVFRRGYVSLYRIKK